MIPALADPSLVALLLVVAAAAGVDLALTIVVLGVAPLLGWATPPGDLAFLQTPIVIAAGLVLYLAEVAMERHPAGFSLWHAFQRWVRLLGLVLLAEMGTDGMPSSDRWLAMGGMVAVGLGSYVASSGWQGMVILRRLPRGTQLLTSGGIDVAFGALLLLALDHPGQALLGLAAVTLLVAPRVPRAIRGHRAVLDAGRGWIRALFDSGAWVEPEQVPPEVRGALATRDDRPISDPRGARALLLTDGLQPGWLLAGQGGAWFVPGGSGAVRLLRRESDPHPPDPLYARVPVTAGERSGDLLVRRDGPTRRELEREIPPGGTAPGADTAKS